MPGDRRNVLLPPRRPTKRGCFRRSSLFQSKSKIMVFIHHGLCHLQDEHLRWVACCRLPGGHPHWAACYHLPGGHLRWVACYRLPGGYHRWAACSHHSVVGYHLRALYFRLVDGFQWPAWYWEKDEEAGRCFVGSCFCPDPAAYGPTAGCCSGCFVASCFRCVGSSCHFGRVGTHPRFYRQSRCLLLSKGGFPW